MQSARERAVEAVEMTMFGKILPLKVRLRRSSDPCDGPVTAMAIGQYRACVLFISNPNFPSLR